ncbi:MAG TPA: sigma-54 dependent transcriptional regulator [Chitinophagales bacterium]|nr:sigma-54 dependent transcriptional regulator [Chitinophagales bacterium]
MAKQNSNGFTVFILEDDDWYRDLLAYVAALNPEFIVKKFSRGSELIKNLYEMPDVVTVDYMLPDMNGEDVLRQIKEFNPDIEVIMISEQERIDTAVELLKLGAYDYVVKTPDIKEKLLNLLHNIRNNQKLKTRISVLEMEVRTKYNFENFIIGKSEAIQQVFALIQKAAETNITVGITGETGTGKEVVAKAIHFNSKRKDGPFVAVNMAAIPKELAESELFGHEKGSFTGAAAARVGKFEEATGGTLLLDEIGEMELSLQTKLLRVLQEKEVSRVGSNKIIKVDCRIIASTNKNLLEEVKSNRFREDLYYRLLGLQIHLPPLRERTNDIPLLAKYFIDEFCRENNLPPKNLAPDAQQKLLLHSFPGNVRELKSIAELAAAMTSDTLITANDIIIQGSNNFFSDLLREETTLEQYEFKIITHFLKKYNDNVVQAAEKLGIGKSTIYKMLKERSEARQSD